MLKRTELIQKIIDRNGYKKYLEIGLHTGENFRNIKCDYKVSVDPDDSTSPTFLLTSDQYFFNHAEEFDIIFIDGLHHAEQVEIDFKNALKYLKQGGTIVIHDCLPRYYLHQAVPRQQSNWTGDVWKAVFKLHKRSDLDIKIVDIETGIGVIKRGVRQPADVSDNLDWDYYRDNRFRIYDIVKEL